LLHILGEDFKKFQLQQNGGKKGAKIIPHRKKKCKNTTDKNLRIILKIRKNGPLFHVT